MRTSEPIDRSIWLRTVIATARERAHPKSLERAVAGALTALVHLALIPVLLSSGGQLGDPHAAPIVMVENFAPRLPLRAAQQIVNSQPLATASVETAPRQTPLEPSKHEPLDAQLTIETQTLDAALVPIPALLAEVDTTVLTSLDRTNEPLAPAQLTDLPKARTIAIEPAMRASLIERVAQAARKLIDATQSEITWQEDGREYRALLKRRSSQDSMELETVAADVTTSEQGMTVETQLLLSRLAFSQFTQVVDRWDPNVQLHDDEIIGRFHSNTAPFVGHDSAATPRFTGKVTTTARSFHFANGGSRRRREAMFQGGLETSAERIDLPPQAPPFVLEPPEAEAHVHRFVDDTHITLHDDGSYSWQGRKATTSQRHVYLTSQSVYLLAARDVTLFLRGTVRGRVVAYSPERIVIESSLIYASNPRLASSADDYLGVISDGNVEIARPYVTGRGDLRIDAAIFARRRFLVNDIDRGRPAILYIYGSLTAGSISATEPRYATKIEFDSRFDRVRPPGFPSTNRYEVASWDGAWREASAVR